MDFRQLKYIMKVVQTGNITKAADELYMTQPALSHFISKIEKEEGIRLFDRTTSPLTLTYAGEKYVNTIRQILELNDRLSAEIAEISGNISGRLVIGIPPARAAELLPRVIPEYSERFPKVEIATVEHNSRQLRDDVERHSVDFAILPIQEDCPFKHIDLFEEELLLVAKKGLIGNDSYHETDDGKKVIEFNKLKDQKFVLLKRGHGIRNAIDFLFKLNGFKPDIFMETTNNETAFCLAATGIGCAIVPEFNIRSYVTDNPVDVFKISEAGMKWTVAAIMDDNVFASKLALEFIDIVKRKYNE